MCVMMLELALDVLALLDCFLDGLLAALDLPADSRPHTHRY